MFKNRLKSVNRGRSYKAIIVPFIILFIIIPLHVGFAKIRHLYTAQLYNQALELMQDFLENEVESFIRNMEVEKEILETEYRKTVEVAKEHLPETSISMTIEGLDRSMRSRPDEYLWSTVAFNRDNKVVFIDEDRLTRGWEKDEYNVRRLFLNCGILDKGAVRYIYGITRETVDENLKRNAVEWIHSSMFRDDSGIWINEIKDYSGGERYALRIADSNDKSLEGKYQSTAFVDEAGHRPYQEELDSLNENGTALYSITVREGEETVTRLIFASKCDNMDWVVCMGMDMDIVDEYLEDARAETERFMTYFEIMLCLVMVAIVGAMLFMTVRIQKRTFDIESRWLKQKVEYDELTGANSRSFGIEKLKGFFDGCRMGKPSPAVMILDIDRFKGINDTYGHDAGDLVLKKVVEALSRPMRASDFLIRWGGDEFIGIYPRVTRENLSLISDKLLASVRGLEVKCGENTIKVTFSAGFAFFEEGDEDYMACVKRADEALYVSKTSGRNMVTVYGSGSGT